jgi:hypothetical protein
VCELSLILAFVLAHIVAWSALGGGWRGAARAPFAVLLPALALLLLDAVFYDNYAGLAAKVMTLVSWEGLYFFLYLCLRITMRQAPPPVES